MFFCIIDNSGAEEKREAPELKGRFNKTMIFPESKNRVLETLAGIAQSI